MSVGVGRVNQVTVVKATLAQDVATPLGSIRETERLTLGPLLAQQNSHAGN